MSSAQESHLPHKRRPLRLKRLPHPRRQAIAPAPASAEDDAPAAADEQDSGWIHEWSQPQPVASTDA